MLLLLFQGNKGEVLSLVTLSTIPPQVSHGAGLTREASHDVASHAALRALAMIENPPPQHLLQHHPAEVKVEGVDHRGDG